MNMVSKVTLSLSDKASENLIKWSKTLGLTQNEFASLCFETVNIKHQGIVLCSENRTEPINHNPCLLNCASSNRE